MRLAPSVAAVLLLVATPAWASPAMVTTTRGAVQLVDGAAKTDAPAPPFLLEEGKALSLGEGALVVVLFEGNATQVLGPATVDHGSLKHSDTARADRVAVLDEVLSRHVSAEQAGAHRGAELMRPVPSSAIVAPGEIRWACDPCEEWDVAIYDVIGDENVWTGKGTGSVTYDGPTLAPGSYSVVLQGFHEYPFTVLGTDQQVRVAEVRKAAEEAAAALGDQADPAARASVIATIYWQMGLTTEALYAIDAAIAAHPKDEALLALRTHFEQKAKLIP